MRLCDRVSKKGLSKRALYVLHDRDSKVALLQPSFDNSIISAKISNKTNFTPRQVVVQHSIHNFGEDLSPSTECMDDGICRKTFPQAVCR